MSTPGSATADHHRETARGLAGDGGSFGGAGLPAVPTPQPLPTLPPGATLAAGRAIHCTRRDHAGCAPVTRARGANRRSPPRALPRRRRFRRLFRHQRVHVRSAAGEKLCRPTDPVQIFYAMFSPTVLRNGAPVRFSAVTTTNVARLTIGYQGSRRRSRDRAGQWQSAYNFSAAG